MSLQRALPCLRRGISTQAQLPFRTRLAMGQPLYGLYTTYALPRTVEMYVQVVPRTPSPSCLCVATTYDNNVKFLCIIVGLLQMGEGVCIAARGRRGIYIGAPCAMLHYEWRRGRHHLLWERFETMNKNIFDHLWAQSWVPFESPFR